MKNIALFSLLVSVAFATYPALNHRDLHRLLTPREAHSYLLGRGTFDLGSRQSCDSGEVACGDGCIDVGDECCPDGDYCPAGQICWPQDSGCCNPGDIVCGDGCMPPGSVCCDADAYYCYAGDNCVLTSGGGSGCCAVGEVCNGQVGITSYPAGTTIGSGSAAPSTSIPSTTTPVETTPVATTPAATTPTPIPAPGTPTTTTPLVTTTEFSAASTTEPATSSFAGAAAPIAATMVLELMAMLAGAAVLL